MLRYPSSSNALCNDRVPVFDQVFARPTPTSHADPELGLGTSRVIGQDSGDVYATLSLGYNFDGTQSPVVARLGDDATTAAALSVPNFYGAHGYDPRLREMSAIFFAAGPHVCRGTIASVRNIDVAHRGPAPRVGQRPSRDGRAPEGAQRRSTSAAPARPPIRAPCSGHRAAHCRHGGVKDAGAMIRRRQPAAGIGAGRRRHSTSRTRSALSER
jgi:hypothetical protein